MIILHHTGKAESSKLFRGSSDIKAAVDTAYLLTGDAEQPGELGKLSMNCLKSRMAPGRHFGMEFFRRKGFVTGDAVKPARTVEEIITDILADRPGCNQTKIVELAKDRGRSKQQVLDCLHKGRWTCTAGPKNSSLYSLPTEGTASDEKDS